MSRKKKRIIEKEIIMPVVENSENLKALLLKKTDELVKKYGLEELIKSDDEAPADKVVYNIEKINNLSAFVDDVINLHDSIENYKFSKYLKYYDLIIEIYNQEKSAYECQEKLEEQDIHISVMQIYNIIHKFKNVEVKK